MEGVDFQGHHERQPAVLNLPRSLAMTSEQFWEICQINRDWRLERTRDGDVVVMPPTGALTGKRNVKLSAQVSGWADRDGSGVAFDSSTGFELPNGAVRSPDVAWVARTRLVGVTRADMERFLPLCPDFVIELRSPTDKLSVLQQKLEEYMANGAVLGWLVDPVDRRVYVYRPTQPVQCLENPSSLSGESVLHGLSVDLTPIWAADL